MQMQKISEAGMKDLEEKSAELMKKEKRVRRKSRELGTNLAFCMVMFQLYGMFLESRTL